jgi:acetyl-CoA C-acetyltransferase
MTAYLTAAFRTAVMPRGGAFATLLLHDLAAPLVQACLIEGGVAGAEISDLILANALGAGGNPARLAALTAGLPERVAGLSIDRQCAGGLDAILLAKAMVESGMAEAVLAGGVESFSRRPLRLCTDPAGGPPAPYDRPPFTPWPARDPEMAEAAAALAARLNIPRQQQDDWAIASHARARAAAGRMPAEIVPVLGRTADGFTRELTPRLAARAPVVTGTVTAANAAVEADAAALCLIVSERLAARAPRALRLTGGRTLGAAPEDPGLAPLPAIRATLAAAGLRPQDMAIAEIMEAFAVQAIACVQGAGLNPSVVNPGGGALARGHPIGASGAILAVRLFHDLRAGHGLAAIAAAGGLGTALLLSA